MITYNRVRGGGTSWRLESSEEKKQWGDLDPRGGGEEEEETHGGLRALKKKNNGEIQILGGEGRRRRNLMAPGEL